MCPQGWATTTTCLTWSYLACESRQGGGGRGGSGGGGAAVAATVGVVSRAWRRWRHCHCTDCSRAEWVLGGFLAAVRVKSPPHQHRLTPRASGGARVAPRTRLERERNTLYHAYITRTQSRARVKNSQAWTLDDDAVPPLVPPKATSHTPKRTVCMERSGATRSSACAPVELVGTVVTSRSRMYALFDCLHVPPRIVVHLSCRMRLHAY